MLGSESHPMSFKNLRHTFYTNTTKVSCVQRESNKKSKSRKSIPTTKFIIYKKSYVF